MSFTATFRSVSADADADQRSRRDLRLVPILLAAYSAAWLGDGLATRAALVLWAACAVAGTVLLLAARDRRTASNAQLRTRTRRRTLAAACFIAAGAGTAATTRTIASHTGPLPRLAAAHARATVEAVITDDPRTVTSPHAHGPFAIVPVRVERVNGQRTRLPATVLASNPDAWRLLPSTRVQITARLRPARPDTPDAAALSVPASHPPQILAGPTALQRLAGHLRQGLREACAGLPADPRGLLPGLVIGDVSQEPDSLSAAFRTTGLSHLTAVSGENLVFLLAAAMPIARLAGVRGRFLILSGLGIVLGFTVLARPEPSMVRASVMALLSLLLAANGRRARGIPLLCAGGTLLLLFDPWLARSFGFALSLSATAGLFILAPGWLHALTDRRVPHRIAESIACTAAAEACCLPILVSLTAEITPLSIPANVLAEFCVGPATVLGAVTLLAAAVWLPLGHAVAWLAQWPTEGIVTIARYGARLPGAAISWPGGPAGSVALLTAYAALILITAAIAARREAR
ncbi:MAG: ComEC/Rec2 family competence protein [Catenulisporales bacterium]|nr:ComEC/Rec2 family competence protein [Catenulisporales bacterium]